MTPQSSYSPVLRKTERIDLANGQTENREWLFDGIRILHTATRIEAKSTGLQTAELEGVQLHFNLLGRTEWTSQAFSTRFGRQEHNMAFAEGLDSRIHFQEEETAAFIIQFPKESFLDLVQFVSEPLQRFSEKITGS